MVKTKLEKKTNKSYRIFDGSKSLALLEGSKRIFSKTNKSYCIFEINCFHWGTFWFFKNTDKFPISIWSPLYLSFFMPFGTKFLYMWIKWKNVKFPYDHFRCLPAFFSQPRHLIVVSFVCYLYRFSNFIHTNKNKKLFNYDCQEIDWTNYIIIINPIFMIITSRKDFSACFSVEPADQVHVNRAL